MSNQKKAKANVVEYYKCRELKTCIFACCAELDMWWIFHRNKGLWLLIKNPILKKNLKETYAMCPIDKLTILVLAGSQRPEIHMESNKEGESE